MKKILFMVLCLVIVFALVGCGQTQTGSAMVSTNDSQSEEAEQPQAPVSEPLDKEEKSEDTMDNSQIVEQPEMFWEVCQVNTNSISEAIRISSEDSRKVSDIIASCKCQLGGAACANDYAFVRDDGSIIYYHSDCGSFNDNVANCSYQTLDKQKTWINNMLFNLFEGA